MGEFGFCWVGLAFLLFLFVPNIAWAKLRKPENDGVRENRLLLALERAGEVCCTVSLLVFDNLNLRELSIRSLWLAAALLLMALYELAWMRWFRSGRTQAELYRRFFGIPLPLALLPVVAVVLLGVYGRLIWVIASAALLGVGHIGLHLQHARAVPNRAE